MPCAAANECYPTNAFHAYDSEFGLGSLERHDDHLFKLGVGTGPSLGALLDLLQAHYTPFFLAAFLCPPARYWRQFLSRLKSFAHYSERWSARIRP